jgi:hypothetical protein
MPYDDDTDDTNADWRAQAGDGPDAESGGESMPSQEEVERLLGLMPEEVARLVVRRPALVQYLEVGVQAAIAAGSQEHDAKSKIAEDYFQFNDKLVDGLLKRLNEPGVTDEERSTIYGLLDNTHRVTGEKATEFIEAQDRTGSKALGSVGLYVMLGLAVALVIVRKQGPSTPPSFFRL